MARCEDFPACMHEDGCCPDYDESGRQLNMVCVCGKKLPINNRSSICDACLRAGDDEWPSDENWPEEDEDIGYCDDCGEEFDVDCNGNRRCPQCDDPCPCCSDGGMDCDEEHDGQPDEAQEWHDFDPDC